MIVLAPSCNAQSVQAFLCNFILPAVCLPPGPPTFLLGMAASMVSHHFVDSK